MTKEEVSFQQELESLINRYSIENQSNTPDFILSQYIINCLKSYNIAITTRERWYGRENNQIKQEINQTP